MKSLIVRCMRPGLLATSLALVACDLARDAADEPDVAEWTATQDLRIGSVDDPEYSLTFFEVMEVGPDGTMYTVHPQEQLVRVFAPDGSLRTTIGGRGDGPGEFQNVARIGWVADTLWLLDLDGYRFSQFTADGRFLGSFSVPFVAGSDPRAIQPPRAYGLLSDGTIHGSPPAFSRQVADGTLTHHIPMLMTREGGVTDTLPAIPFGRNEWAISNPDAPRRGALYRSQPFADGPLWDFVPGEPALIILTRTAASVREEAAFVISKVSFDGDTLFSLSYRYEPVPTRQEAVDSILDEISDRIGERGMFGATAARVREWAASSLYQPAFEPPVRAMVVARDGTIWLDRGPHRREDISRWLVFDADGRALAALELPAKLTVLQVIPPYLWGFENDETDVPYLIRFRIAASK